MNFNEYQKRAGALADYPDIFILQKGSNESGNESEDEYISANYIYPALGLGGETGEAVDKIKKIVRNKYGIITQEDRENISKELGDILWYIQQMAYELEIPFDDIACLNIKKLEDRKKRNVIKSEGDNR